MFVCLECGKLFASEKAASRAVNSGCPKCGGVDIDLAPIGVKRPGGPLPEVIANGLGGVDIFGEHPVRIPRIG